MPQSPFMHVQTDAGRAAVFHQGPRTKWYKCPLCEDKVENEWHVVIVPENVSFRRHAHKECFDMWLEQDLEIKILPGHKY